MKKRLTAVILLLSILGGTFVGCSENSGDTESKETTNDNVVDASAESEEGVAEEETTLVTDGLPETDMNGYELKILHHSQEWLSWAYNVLEAEETTGEALNDAIYKRRYDLQDRFNAVITTEPVVESNEAAVAEIVLTGDSTYSIVMMYDLRVTGALNYLNDMKELPYVSFDEAWWNPEASAIFNIGGTQYAASGNYSLSVLSRAGGYAFNGDIITKLNLDSPYELVHNNQWTIDNFYKLADAANQDIDGDGQTTSSDQFGIEGSTKEHFLRMIFGSGVSIIKTGEDGYPSFALTNNELAVTKLQHIIDLSKNGGWLDTNSGGDLGAVNSVVAGSFDNGNCLFTVSNPTSLANTRDLDFNVGFVPVPKYDETQENYYSPAFGSEISVLPKTYDTSNAEYIGMLLEAMAFYTQQNIIPLYTESVVKSKYARDAESSEMISICFDSIYFDFGINAWQEQAAARLLNGSFVELKGNFGSVIKTMDKVVQSETKKLKKQIEG